MQSSPIIGWVRHTSNTNIIKVDVIWFNAKEGNYLQNYVKYVWYRNIVNAVLGAYMHSVAWLQGMGLEKSHSVHTLREKSFHTLNSAVLRDWVAVKMLLYSFAHFTEYKTIAEMTVSLYI